MNFREPRAFTLDERKDIESFANLAAKALQKARIAENAKTSFTGASSFTFTGSQRKQIEITAQKVLHAIPKKRGKGTQRRQ